MPIGLSRVDDVSTHLPRTMGNEDDIFSSPGGGNTASRIARDQWQNFLDVYRPVEDDILETAMNTDFTAQGDQAGSLASAAINASRGTAARNVSRSGGALTGEERAAIARRQDLARTKGVGQAENVTRRSLSDSRTNLLQSIVQIGTGVQQTASAGANSVANMANARELQYQNQSAQASATNISSVASIAALALAL